MGPSLNEIWAALAWGAVSSVGLLVGAIAGWFSRLSHHAIAMGMSVGAGMLLATVSVKLAADAIRIAGPVPAVVSLLLGAGVFSAVNAFLARFGAAHRKRCGECTQQASSWCNREAEWPLLSALDLTLCRTFWCLGLP